MELYLHAFLTFALNVDEWLASYPSHFTPKNRLSSIQWVRGWLHCTACLVALEKIEIYLSLPQIKPQLLSHSTHNLQQACTTCHLQSFMMWPTHIFRNSEYVKFQHFEGFYIQKFTYEEQPNRNMTLYAVDRDVKSDFRFDLQPVSSLTGLA